MTDQTDVLHDRNWIDAVAHVGGLLFVVFIVGIVLIVIWTIIMDKIDEYLERKTEEANWQAHMRKVEEAQNDFS